MQDDSHPLDYYPEDDTGDDLTDSLALIDRARSALAQAENLADIGAVREIAERARRYASAAKLGRAAENHAARLRIEAERKAGALLDSMDRHRQCDGRPKVGHDEPLSKPKLPDLGVSPRQAKDWTRIARVPDEVFEAHVEQVQAKGEALTTSGIVQVARQMERQARAAEPKPIIAPETVPARIEVGSALSMNLPDDAVHLIVTSPPYGVGVEYPDGDIPSPLWQSFMLRWLTEALRVSAPGGRLALNVPLDTFSGGCRPTYAQAVQAAIEAGWRYRSTILWADNELGKSTARGSVDSPSSPYIYAGAEPIALFSKGPWKRQPPCPPDIDHSDWVAWTNGLWRFRGVQVPWEGHPASFPLELPRRLILLLSFPGDVVLDPFVGSGTTALAAMQLGRQAIGFDRSERYVQSTLRRLAALGGRERPGAVGETGAGAGVPMPGAGEVLAGGLRRRVDRGAGGATSEERIPAGRAGVIA